MPWKYSDEYYREYTRVSWNESADAYVEFMAQLAPYRADLLAALHARPGETILDLGTGPGEPALTLAGLVGPGGRVVGVDLSERMVEKARASAGKRGLANVEFRAMDCSHLDLADATFDAAVSSFGFQIFTDPEGAARECHRVLRPGGRLAVSVWGTAEVVPCLHAMVGPMLENAEPDETGYLPTPYETGGPGEMVEFLQAAGFRSATETRVQHSFHFRDADHYLRSVLEGTPLGHSLREEEPAVQSEVLRKTRENLQRWSSPAGLVLPAEAVVVVARR